MVMIETSHNEIIINPVMIYIDEVALCYRLMARMGNDKRIVICKYYHKEKAKKAYEKIMSFFANPNNRVFRNYNLMF